VDTTAPALVPSGAGPGNGALTGLAGGGHGGTVTRDTVRIPGAGDRDQRTVVRPALAVLFRVAVGPNADAYVPRFLDFERAGRPSIAWHWPAFFAGPAWAFYRRLWVAGIAFALTPLAGAFAFSSLSHDLDGSGPLWWVALLLCVVVVPALLPALSAHALLYRRVQGVVARAEGETKSASKAVELVSRVPAVSVAAALAFGGGALAVTAATLAPPIAAEHDAQGTRHALATGLADVRLVQDAVESAFRRTGTFAHARNVGALVTRDRSGAIDDVSVSPVTGRVRVSLAPGLAGAGGKALLLQPVVDGDRVIWVCVPVDIAPRYLPDGCRR